MLAGRRASGVAMGAALALVGLGAVAVPATGVNANYGHAIVSQMPKKGTPHVMDGAVQAITQVGNTIIVGGTFTSVSPADTFTDTSDDLVRNRLFAFDATTGVIDPSFNPNMGGEVRSLDTDGTYVYAAGAFGSVGGKTAYKRIVKLDLTGAPVTGFKVKPSAVTNEVVVRGSRVYIGGGFKRISSRSTPYDVGHLAILDKDTGTPDTAAMNLTFAGVYNPGATNPGTTNVKRFDVTADGTRLAVIGNFATINGLARNQVAVLDTSGPTTTLTSFATNRFDRAHSVCSQSFDTFLRDLDFSPDGKFFVVSTTGSFGGGANANSLCDTTSRWETDQTSNDPTWIDYTGGDTSYGVAVTGDVVYIGGHFRWQNNPFQGDQAGPGAVARQGIAALDVVNGLPVSWNPGRDRGVGAQALLATPEGLWVGSDTTIFNSQRRGRIAFLPLAGGTTVPTVPPAHLPNTLFGMQTSTPGKLVSRPVSSSGAPTGPVSVVDDTVDWSSVRGAFLLNGTLYYGRSDNSLYKRSFNAATGVLGTQSAVNLYDDPDSGARIPFAISTMTGMFYEPTLHRIYYTVAGDARLFYRYFTPESEVVGALTFTADAGGVNFASAQGLTLADGKLIYGSSDGALRSVSFSGGRVTGSPTTLSSDGTSKYRGMFLPNG
ncbi:hypothetical protein [Nocardioides taihuensis]|uniref:Uncharacterized protein n=1 Tax=Nocardioides taihuensis TaxID=1835606 RepID=A0ABW0BJY3_9ACTN